jgi:hypothetical protein
VSSHELSCPSIRLNSIAVRMRLAPSSPDMTGRPGRDHETRETEEGCDCKQPDQKPTQPGILRRYERQETQNREKDACREPSVRCVYGVVVAVRRSGPRSNLHQLLDLKQQSPKAGRGGAGRHQITCPLGALSDRERRKTAYRLRAAVPAIERVDCRNDCQAGTSADCGGFNCPAQAVSEWASANTRLAPLKYLHWPG